ncbi:MATE family efflux transporter [Alkaliphilus peptidifermentans]|uniref:Putative efflux protein, MATE family n=1 Tax=Alkaliphilus peptidifermentans DSM 18978 TaxID=1120976 RepID=A0A1G5FP83_9FIRM|nr:MATE family efflux transporter [Alkaliphilus peptidifermentans]SCY40610.1 putative efflux protein, MATE family [Alkaliphilus peptidifermentans DSM 18978]
MKIYQNRNVDMGSGKILTTLLKVSIPAIIAMLFQTGFNIVDTIFVSRLGQEAIAAVSIAFPIQFMIIALANGTSMGLTALISKNLGMGDVDKASQIGRQGIFISCFVSLLITAVGLVFIKDIFKLLGASAQTLPLATDYMTYIIIGTFFIFLNISLSGILRAEGDHVTPMNSMIISTIINIVLDPIFIFGFGFIPSLGVKGAAIATLLAKVFSFFYVFYYIIKGKTQLNLSMSNFKIDMNHIVSIYRIGIPTSLGQLGMNVSAMIVNRILAQYGDVTIGTLGIANRLESLAFMPIFGIMSGFIPMIGYNYGRKDYKRLKETVLLTAKISAVFMAIVGGLFTLYPTFFLRIFTDDAEILRIGSSYLRIITWTYFFIGIDITLSCTFQGLGKGFYSMFCHFTRLFILKIPAILIFMKLYGLNGVWYGTALSNSLTIIVSTSLMAYMVKQLRKELSSNNMEASI